MSYTRFSELFMDAFLSLRLILRTRQIIRYRATANIGDRKISNIQPQNRGVQNQQEHHIIFTKYEAVNPTAVSENYSSSGMLII